MEEAPENGKKSSHSAHGNGMNEWMNACMNHWMSSTGYNDPRCVASQDQLKYHITLCQLV
jgi:hypothetical protein